jgi:DsbC/DsbD-like thiol-disulfide interchange protein
VALLILSLLAILAAPPQHITVSSSASAASVKPGTKLSLYVDVVPGSGIHVYAPGADDFEPIGLKIDAADHVTMGKLEYPPSERMPSGIPGETVPVYQKPFRLVQPVTVAKAVRPGSVVTVAATVRYQACDDRVCFVPATLPVSWTIHVR